MNRQDLDRHLHNNSAPRAMALFGESHFLIDRYAHRIAQIEGASVLSLYHDEYDFNTAKAHLSQGSLFGDQNLLIIKHEKKLPKAELDTLIELVGKNPDNTFIYCYYGEDVKGIDAAFKGSHAGSVRFFHPFATEARAIVMQEAQAQGIQLDNQAAFHLLDIHNNDLALACNELSKLSILGKPIGMKEIDEHVFGLSEIKLDHFITRVIEKKEFLPSLRHLLESGENEIQLLTAISGFLTQLYLFNSAIKIHGVADSALVLGYKLPGFIEKERAALSIKISLEGYKRGINFLLDTELKMKSTGSPDQESLLLSALLKLQMIL
ncbi:DNA polymerase III subunit delta [Sulfuricurvum sp.]|uniref:DNA polymerase III subunit delta n=1 Tax=Sulfuricurvum sp. TaxID=2025608 RepID=UPI0019998C7C|nr:DNA polymerase III subunit delta [Sulfuricurvum sp.]MBD3799348.1 DNA polymerase III subunit delta [Campylobacterota bacterium]MBD3806762.1 DNA polymerase III subunit delta [Sulfuricurvum sp.]